MPIRTVTGVFGRLSSTRRPLSGLFFGAVVATAALFCAAPAPAHDYKAGSIKIAHPWSRATPPSATIGAGYLTLTNEGSEPDRLIGATSTAARSLEVHEMSVDDGVMRMKPVAGGLEIPAGGTVALEPGGLHFMIMGLTKPLVEGERVPVTLTFEKAGSFDVELAIDKLGTTTPTKAGNHGASHDAAPEAAHGSGHEAGHKTEGEAAPAHAH